VGLPIPNLDNKKFDELVEEARLLIARHAKETWTDHNIHDPGITFIELFAWLAEMQIYQLNQLTIAQYEKFLKLVGLYPESAKAAAVDVTFSNVTVEKSIAAGTALSTVVGDDNIVFETTESINLIPQKLVRIITFYDEMATDNFKANSQENMYFAPFGEKALEGTSLLLGFDQPLPENKIHLTLELYETDLPPAGQFDNEPPFVHPPVNVVWEYLSGGDWHPLVIHRQAGFKLRDYSRFIKKYPHAGKILQPLIEVAHDEICLNMALLTEEQRQDLGLALNEILRHDNTDSVLSMLTSGRIVFDGPSAMSENEGHYWIRSRLLQGRYEIVPRIDRLLINTVPAVQVETIRNEPLDAGLDRPGQKVSLKNSPVISDSQRIEVQNDKDEWEPWSSVEDFELSGPGDLNYIFDPQSGEIVFGNGLNGRVPAASKLIRAAEYKITKGSKGNIPKGQHFLYEGFEGVNLKPGYGGEDAESLEHAISRARKEFRTRYRAITSQDYEILALSTPGLRVARAWAIANYNTDLPCIGDFPAAVTVVVVPYTRAGETTPMPSDGFIKTVYEHLNKHRLITSSLHVAAPEYVKISIDCKIHIKNKSDPDAVERRVQEALTSFLDPIRGGTENNGWPFGRAVYSSEIYQVIDKVVDVDFATDLVVEAQGNFRQTSEIVTISKTALVYSGIHQVVVIPAGKVHQETV
jgi:hypothetical protein